VNSDSINKIILASASPRRRELLEKCGVPFEVLVSNAEEKCGGGSETPAEVALHNALLKARAVAKDKPLFTVLGSDTIVVLGDEIIGKPPTRRAAVDTLLKLSGKTHTVITAIALVNLAKNTELSAFEESRVTFKKLTETIIEDYMGKVNVMDKAGAYGAQEYGDMIIENIDGNLDNVMGLPCALVKNKLDSLSSL